MIFPKQEDLFIFDVIPSRERKKIQKGKEGTIESHGLVSPSFFVL